MPLYFFDTHDDNVFIEDDDGVELPDIEAAKLLASASLAELAKDVIPGSEKRVLVVEVRDVSGPVLDARLTFEAIVLRANAA